MAPRNRINTRNISLKPPRISSDPELHHVYRFVCSPGAVNNVLVTGAGILGAVGTFTSATNSSVVPICNSFKIKRVRIWAPSSSASTISTISLEWAALSGGTLNQSGLQYSDTSMNPSVPAFLDLIPPKDSVAHFWNQTGNSALMNISCPQYTVIDLHVHAVMSDNTAAASIVVATAALGFEYFLALDGPSTNNFVPVALQTTH
jgi:hypothetical protein